MNFRLHPWSAKLRNVATTLLQDAKPTRAALPWILANASSFLLLVALLVTLCAKGFAVASLHEARWARAYLQVTAHDCAVFFGLIAVFALFEATTSRARWLTTATAVLIALTSGANALYLLIAGEQANRRAFEALFDHWDDAMLVLDELRAPLFALVMGTALLIAAVLGFRRARQRWGESASSAPLARFGVAASATVLSLPLIWVVGAPKGPGMKNIAGNWLVRLSSPSRAYKGRKNFKSYAPRDLIDEDAIGSLASRDAPPNVLLIILESTRYDYTSLAPNPNGLETPHLAALAQRGFTAHQARAVIPHTSKSLWTILCGRLPLVQRALPELSKEIELQCLPELLSSAGYRTAFFQSAFGTFEARPRLVDKFGFEYFKAWEDIRGRRLGYLASNDSSLFKPFKRWIRKGKKSEPWFAAVLTSATHHPYRLPPVIRKRVDDADSLSAEERYALLVEHSDRLLGRFITLLKDRGQLENTIIVVVGDHGEGFGEYGVKQHDNNYYEEGLRVPMVFAGPGVEPGRLDEAATLLDVTPTVLGLLGLSPPSEVPHGHDVMSADHPGDDGLHVFSCYSNWACHGFVKDRKKYVYFPQDNDYQVFDLADDPEERSPETRDFSLLPEMRELRRLFSEYQVPKKKKRILEPVMHYTKWVCDGEDVQCKHPKAKDKKLRPEASSSAEE